MQGKTRKCTTEGCQNTTTVNERGWWPGGCQQCMERMCREFWQAMEEQS
jgi:hypothetical protein